MPEKDPTHYSLLTYMWVFGLSAWGGAVSFIRKVRSGHTSRFNFLELIGELVTSAFAGVITFYLCESSGFSQLWTAVMVGVSGHMGTRAIYFLESVFKASANLAEQKNEAGR